MSLQNPLRVHLWWDTAIGRGDNNSVYFEGNAKKTFILRNQLNYVDFVSKIRELMGALINGTLHVTLLHPIQYGNHVRFVSTSVSNDEDMEMMYQLQQDFKGLNQVEIHVERCVPHASNVGDSLVSATHIGTSTAPSNQGNCYPILVANSEPPAGMIHRPSCREQYSSQALPVDVHSRCEPVVAVLRTPMANMATSASCKETNEIDPHGMRVYSDAVTKLVQHEMARGPMQPAEMDAYGPFSDIGAGADSDSEHGIATNEPANAANGGETVLGMSPPTSGPLTGAPNRNSDSEDGVATNVPTNGKNTGEAIPGMSPPPSGPHLYTPNRTHCPPGLSYFSRLGEFDSNGATDPGVSLKMNMWSESNNDLSLGMKFVDKSEVITAARLWSMKEGREYRVVESTSKAWDAKCKFSEKTQCPWHMRAIHKKKLGVWQLTKFGPEHACKKSVEGNDHQNLSSRLIAKKILHVIAEDPEVKCKIIRSHIHDTLGVHPTYKKCWKGRKFAIEMVYGDLPSSFAILPQFLNAIIQANPGAVVEWSHHTSSTEEVKYFRYLFWAFRPCIEAFRSTHKVVSVDGTHICGAYKGKLLVAMTVDANNHVLPLAFAVVNEETSDSWGWFLAMLRRHVVGNERGVCLITDRHDGIMNAVSSQAEWQPPMGYHRFCLRHLQSTFNTCFKDATLKILCWQAGKARQKHKFDGVMESIKRINEDAFKWLSEIPPELWTLAYDGGFRCGQLTTNFSECYDNVIKGARALPIKSCVNLTFERLVNYFGQHRDAAAKCNASFPQKPWKMFNYFKQRSRTHSVQVLNAQIGVFSVTSRRHDGKGGNVYSVNFPHRHCSCGKWNIFKIPCSHAIAASRPVGVNPVGFVSSGYSTAAYRATYDGQFFPIPHEDNWQSMPFSLRVVPDKPQNTRSGKLRTLRTQNEIDELDRSAMRKCSKRHQPDHNRPRCTSISTVAPPDSRH